MFVSRRLRDESVGAPVAFPDPVRVPTTRILVLFQNDVGDNFETAGAEILFFDHEATARRLYRAFENRLGVYIRYDPRYARQVPEITKNIARHRNVIVVWNPGFDTPQLWQEIVLGCLRTR
jgi:hypothetical protein